MFEQQIIGYLQPYGIQPAVQKEIADAVGKRLTQQPCQPGSVLTGNLLMQYSWAGEKQKSWYRALLAAAMKGNSMVHPSFPFLMSQMDETDLTLLDTIGKKGRMPVLDCYLSQMKKSGGFTGKPCEDVISSFELITRMTDFLPSDGDYERVQAAIDNLLRLHLVEIRMYAERQALEEIQDNQYEDIYLLFQQVVDETVKQFCDHFPQYRERSIRLQAGNLTLSALGNRFLQVCS